MKKQLLAVIWILILMFSYQQAFAAKSTCGTNVRYTISEDTVSFEKADSKTEAVWGDDCKEAFRNFYYVTIVNVEENIRVIDASGIFSECIYVEKMRLAKLDVSNAVDWSDMFANCCKLKSLNLSSWDTSNVKDMSGMFNSCVALTSLDLSGWDTSSVKDMSGMFGNCSSLTRIDVSGWDTSSVIDMSSMFEGCSSLKKLNAAGWNTGNVTDMSSMFRDCHALRKPEVSLWDTGNVTDMSSMFRDCHALRNLDVSLWNTSNVTKMDSMFRSCSSLKSLDLNGWDTADVEDMNSMFYGCSGLQSLYLSTWNISKVTDTGMMFSGCSSMDSLDLSDWNTSGLSRTMDDGPDRYVVYKKMFFGCSALKTLTLGNDTLKTNIFDSLPAYHASWYYVAQNASDPLPLNTLKTNGKLFTAYKFNKMAGTWSTVPLAETVAIQNAKGMDITGQTVKIPKKTYLLRAITSPKASAQEFIWKSSNRGVAVVDADGKVTFQKAGTVRITAKAADGSGVSNWVKLKTDIKAKRISIRNAAGKAVTHKTLRVKTKTVQLEALALPVKFAAQKFTWESSNTKIAAVNTSGKVTFKKAGTVKITATAADGSKKWNWVNLTYKPSSGKSAEPAVIEIPLADPRTIWVEPYQVTAPGSYDAPVPGFDR